MTFPAVGPSLFHPVPVTPTGLSVTPTSGSEDTSLTLTWTDSQNFYKWHKIERAPDVSGSPGTWATIVTEHLGGSPYVNSGRTENTKYWYRVTGENWMYSGTTSSQASGTTEYEHITSAPTWFSTYPKADTSDYDSILLRFNAITQYYTLYRVYWKDGSALNGSGYTAPTNHDGSFTLSTPTTEYDHEGGFSPGDTIYYQARAENPDSNGPFSANASAYIPIVAPDPPTAVAASVVGSDAHITWVDESWNEDNFRIEYQDRFCDTAWDSVWHFLTSPAAEAESYDWGGIIDGKEYLFRVRAENAGGNSAYDSMVDGEEITYTITITAPTWDGVPTEGSPGIVTLDWFNGSGTIDETEIHRSLTSNFTPGPTTLLYTVPVSTLTKNDSVGATLNAPTGLSVTALSATALRVGWSGPPDADEWDIYRAPTSGGTFVYQATATSEPWDDSGLDANEDYFYKIIARDTAPGTIYYKLRHINNCGETGPASTQGSVVLAETESGFSSETSGTTWPGSPLSFDVALDSTNCPIEEADLSWTNGGNNTSTFTIRWSNISSSGGWTTLTSTLAAGSTAYHHSTPSEGDNWYEIKFNTGGDSSWSAKFKSLVCFE